MRTIWSNADSDGYRYSNSYTYYERHANTDGNFFTYRDTFIDAESYSYTEAASYTLGATLVGSIAVLFSSSITQAQVSAQQSGRHRRREQKT